MTTDAQIFKKALELAVGGDAALIEKFVSQARAELAPQDPLAGITAEGLKKANRDMGFTK